MQEGSSGFKLGYRPELDGLRGIAILIVLLGHFLNNIVPARLGVELFFALSGFLITSLLLEEQAKHGRIHLKGFYLRRVLRLGPALVLFCLVCTIVPHFFPLLRPSSTALYWVMSFTANYGVIFDHVHFGGLYGITWSLAVEEQFYLLWPIGLVLFFKKFRLAQLPRVCLFIILAMEGWRWYLLADMVLPLNIYLATDARGHTLLMGCLLACLAKLGIRGDGESQKWAKDLLFFAVLVGVLAIPCTFDLYAMLLSFYGLMMSLLVWAAAFWREGLAGKFLRWSVLRWFGRISYGLYLLHWPINLILLDYPQGEWDPLVGIVASVLFAAVSYYAMERQFLKLKSRTRLAAAQD